MKIRGHEITIQRGETFTLDMKIVMTNGEPFRIDEKTNNPYIRFVIASDRYKRDGYYHKVWWLPLDKVPKFKTTEICAVSDIDQVVDPMVLYYIEDSERYVYKTDNSDTSELKDYEFRVIKSFSHSDTIELVGSSYLYSITFVSGTLVSDTLKYIIDSEYYRDPDDGTIVGLTKFTDEITGEFNNEGAYNFINKVQPGRVSHIDVTSLFETVDMSLPIVNPSKLIVISNMLGGTYAI